MFCWVRLIHPVDHVLFMWINISRLLRGLLVGRAYMESDEVLLVSEPSIESVQLFRRLPDTNHYGHP